MQKNTFLLLFTLFCSYLSAQEIQVSGTVKTSTGEPAVWAEVIIPKQEKGTITDSLGNYEFKLKPGAYQLKITLMGYKEYIKEIVVDKENNPQELPLSILEEDYNELGEVVIKTKSAMRIKQEKGKLKVAVAGTNFDESINAWEGLKKTPLLDVGDGKDVKIMGKKAMVEINGIETMMEADQLEDYLKSLDPQSIKEIEVEPNPGAKYGSEIEAYVNIVLKNKINNYRLGLNSTNGFKNKYFNNSNINFALNTEKIQLFTNYTFSYDPQKNHGTVIEEVEESSRQTFFDKNESLSRNHIANINFGWDLNEKNTITLNNLFLWKDDDFSNLTTKEDFEREVYKANESQLIQLSQSWKHRFNDTVYLKVGGYEVFRKNTGNNLAITNSFAEEKQRLTSDIPIYIAYADFHHENKWGITETGLKYRNITVENDNQNKGINEYSSPYNYKEEVLAAYLEHTLNFNNGSNLTLGLRSESSFIKYDYTNPITEESYHNKPEYTNILYSADYNWTNKKERYFNLAFRKTIDRPDYSALNPFQEISDNLIYSSGDTRLDPAQFYSLDFYTFKGDWVFYANTGYVKDFISNFFEVENNQINMTYQNFKDVYLASAGFQYNKSFFRGKWMTKTGAGLSYFILKDSRFSIENSTPAAFINTNNSVQLADKLNLNIDFSVYPRFKDGLMDHKGSSKLDISISQKIGNQFSLLLYAHNILKTDRHWEHTTVPNYYYETKMYPSYRTFGLTVKYTITGRAYKEEYIQEDDDQAIDRLD